MKYLAHLILFGFCFADLFAQSPEKFTYQSVIRDAGNNLVVSQVVGVRLSILQGSVNGALVYAETHSPVSNTNGLISLEVGGGNIVSGNFASINWLNGPYFLKSETDPSGGTNYSISGASQLLSVPYSLHSKQAETVINDQVNDADADPVNELQVISFSNDTLYLSNGGSVYLGSYAVDLVDDADNNPSNEIELPASANVGDVLQFNGSNWVPATPVTVNCPGAVMYIYDGQACPSGWTTQQINVAVFGGVPVDACWTNSPCMVMYIYDGQTCPSGWTLQNINAAVINGSTTPVDACFKCN